MRRGEVWWISSDPPVGGEIRKTRPVVIVSNNAANEHLNRVQVVPLTSSVDRAYRSEALVSIRGRKSKAVVDQLTTVSKSRLYDRETVLTAADMRRVERAIRVQPGLLDAL